MSTSDYRRLVDAALEVSRRAYAPYSRFSVGAAIAATTGEIFTGTNVENVSYGLTICAERAAVFSAVAAGVQAFSALAIASPGGVSPCGACRQVLAEFCDDLTIYLVDAKADADAGIECVGLADLMPRPFSNRG